MSILSRIQTIRTPVPERYKQPSLRDVGVDYMGSRLGGCARACWYKVHKVEPTDPPDEAYVLNMRMDEEIREIYISKLTQSAKVLHAPFQWEVQGLGEGRIIGRLDAVYEDGKQNVGVLIFGGTGYGFRTEVFGAKNREGRMKDDHLALSSCILHLCPLPLTKVEVLYVERGNISDAVCYTIERPAFGEKEASQDIASSTADGRPGCSFEKVWTDPVKVATLFADKKISKERYTTWKEGHIGGDWQCAWCIFLKQCIQDDMKTGNVI